MTAKIAIQRLSELHAPKVPFSVVFTGKKRKTEHGHYEPRNHKIVVHANYSNDNDIFYVLMHEYIHHLQITELFYVRGRRFHDRIFYMLLEKLAEKAQDYGFYKIKRK